MPLSVTIITPEKAFPTEEADSVILPAFDGQVGILPKHAAYVCLLGHGELKIQRQQTAEQCYALSGGVAQVANDEIRILAEQVAHVDSVTEDDLVKELMELDAGTYESGLDLAEAQSRANWLSVQLKAKGKAVPELKQLK